MKQISQLIREIIPVIFGILIALVINNWNEDRKDKKYLNQIFSTIEAELKESSADIKEKIPKQRVLTDSLRKYMNDEAVSIIDVIMRSGGIHKPNIKNNSWKALANSRIELIEFEKLSILAEIDNSKDNLELKGEKFLDFMIENIKKSDPEKKEVLILLNEELISSEEYLHYEIEEYLKESPIDENIN